MSPLTTAPCLTIQILVQARLFVPAFLMNYSSSPSSESLSSSSSRFNSPPLHLNHLVRFHWFQHRFDLLFSYSDFLHHMSKLRDLLRKLLRFLDVVIVSIVASPPSIAVFLTRFPFLRSFIFIFVSRVMISSSISGRWYTMVNEVPTKGPHDSFHPSDQWNNGYSTDSSLLIFKVIFGHLQDR